MTLAKAFGLPKAPVLGENARIELRVDAYNLFNNLNLNPNQISNNIGSSNFGTITGALAGRVITLGARSLPNCFSSFRSSRLIAARMSMNPPRGIYPNRR